MFEWIDQWSSLYIHSFRLVDHWYLCEITFDKKNLP